MPGRRSEDSSECPLGVVRARRSARSAGLRDCLLRMFVAVVPPEGVVEDLEEFLAPRREAAGFRWTVPDQWHLTLAFSANVPDRSYDDLVARLTRAAAKRSPMQARIAGGGAFPNVGRAKVLFAGVETEPRRGGAASGSHRRPGRPGQGRRRGGRPAVPAAPHPGADGPPRGGDQLGPAARRLCRPDLADRGARPGRLTPRRGPTAASSPRGGGDLQSRPRW